MILPDLLVIPYGVETWSPADLATTGPSTEGPAARVPCVAVDRRAGEPLRLNTARFDPGATPGTPPAADAATALRDHLRALCPPWDGLARRFVDAYFAYLRDALAANAPRAAARLAPFAGLYAPQDWLFSALAPLPRAHLPAPAGEGPGEEATVRVDFAFWRGDGLAAAVSADSGLSPRRARTRDARLAAAGIEAVRFGPADLAGPALFDRLLTPRHAAFWEAEPVPSGPFSPVALSMMPESA